MARTLKGFLPIVMGLMAAACYWLAVYRSAGSVAVVRVNRDIRAGEAFAEADLEGLAIPGRAGSLAGACVPFADRAVLIGRPSDRDLRKGDPVLWRDADQAPTELAAGPDEQALAVSLEGVSVVPRLLVVGGEVGFLVEGPAAATGRRSMAGEGQGGPLEYVGPFRVLSVGERLSRLESGRDGRGGAGLEARVITVAITLPDRSRSIDERSRRLVDAMGPGSSRSGRIRAVVLKPARRLAAGQIAAAVER